MSDTAVKRSKTTGVIDPDYVGQGKIVISGWAWLDNGKLLGQFSKHDIIANFRTKWRYVARALGESRLLHTLALNSWIQTIFQSVLNVNNKPHHLFKKRGGAPISLPVEHVSLPISTFPHSPTLAQTPLPCAYSSLAMILWSRLSKAKRPACLKQQVWRTANEGTTSTCITSSTISPTFFMCKTAAYILPCLIK